MRLYIFDDEQKIIIGEAIDSDLGLFFAVEESLGVLGQWWCRKCMNICTLSRACHHPDCLICVIFTAREIESNALGTLKPSIKVPGTLGVKEGLVLDAGLLERIF
jgi:hypothetical protein